jgi:hypothetical protein
MPAALMRRTTAYVARKTTGTQQAEPPLRTRSYRVSLETIPLLYLFLYSRTARKMPLAR